MRVCLEGREANNLNRFFGSELGAMLEAVEEGWVLTLAEAQRTRRLYDLNEEVKITRCLHSDPQGPTRCRNGEHCAHLHMIQEAECRDTMFTDWA